MELTLFITGIIALIFAKASKILKNKKILESKNFFSAWNAAFALIGGGLIIYIFNFMAKNGVQGGLAPRTFALMFTAVTAWTVYNFLSAGKADIKKKEKIFSFNMEWAETVYFAAFFAAVVMFLFIQAFKIPSASMRNTLLEGDNLFVNKITYGIRLPFMKDRIIKFNDIKKGDIIVFRFPADSKEQINCGESQYGRDFVKRVIAMPGDVVEINNKQVIINGEVMPPQPYEVYQDIVRFEERPLPYTQEEYQKLWEEGLLEKHLGVYLRDYFGPVTVPEGTYLGIGDNRDASCDSRFWGPVPEENIKGKAWFIHWPISRIGFVK